jgi:hypothetical protein
MNSGLWRYRIVSSPARASYLLPVFFQPVCKQRPKIAGLHESKILLVQKMNTQPKRWGCVFMGYRKFKRLADQRL